MKDALVIQSRQVEVYQLESFIATDHDSSSSSSSSKVAMGGPGTLDVAAWVVSPCFGIIEESEAKVTLYIRNFTKKKVFDTWRRLHWVVWEICRTNHFFPLEIDARDQA
jgi:hypothetical protein